MAYSKTPVNSTYQTKVIGLMKEMNNRAAAITTDELYVNVYAEEVKNKTTQEQVINIIKRAGSTIHAALVSATIRGAFLWKDQNKLLVAIGTDIYIINANTGAAIATLAGVFVTSSGTVGFCEFLYASTVVKIIATDGTPTGLCTIDAANTVVHNADADLPNHLPVPVFLDGYLFVLKLNTADVYNSVNDDPLSWNNEYITAEMRADTAQNICLLNNYLVVFGTESIEYFYDAANVTGSPLSRNDSPIKLVGYLGGLAQIGNAVYFVGENFESEPDIFILEDFKITPLATAGMKRQMAGNVGITNPNFYGSIVAFGGHSFYIIHTGDVTYCMELETRLWTTWRYSGTTSFPIVFSAQSYGSAGYRNLFIKAGTAGVYRFDPALYQDNGGAFDCIIQTENEMFESYNRKTCSRLTVWADKPPGTAPMLIQWSDNDYQTWNTGQTVDLFQEMPCIYRLGQFRRRAHRLTFSANQPLRLTRLEVDINLGAS